MFVCQRVCLYVCIVVCPSAYRPLCLFACLSIYVSVYLNRLSAKMSIKARQREITSPVQQLRQVVASLNWKLENNQYSAEIWVRIAGLAWVLDTSVRGSERSVMVIDKYGLRRALNFDYLCWSKRVVSTNDCILRNLRLTSARDPPWPGLNDLSTCLCGRVQVV